MDIQGWQNSGVSGENGIVHVFNNTMYACGIWTSPPYNGSSGGVIWSDGTTTTKGVRLDNNIIQLTSGPAFKAYVMVDCRGNCNRVIGANNVLFGADGMVASAALTHSLFADPQFVNARSGDFHLLSGSPARAVGTSLDPKGGLRGSPATDAAPCHSQCLS